MKNKSERDPSDRPAFPLRPCYRKCGSWERIPWGREGMIGGSQDAVFTGKGEGEKEEEGKRTLKKLCEMVAAADLGLQSEEENSVPTELAHYLSCN